MMAERDEYYIQLQIAYHCAPLILGFKVSNLLIIGKEKVPILKKIFSGGNCKVFELFSDDDKSVIFAYDSKKLLKHIFSKKQWEFMKIHGYNDKNIDTVIKQLSERYGTYRREGGSFPHEMGIILGYPLEDVKGFIDHNGKHFVMSGYWKVYSNPRKARRIFKRYDYAREKLVYYVADGGHIEDLLIYSA